jgi:hypothetical protein
MAVTSYPNIVFNADTGANTEFSSGAGPGDGVTSGSALTGTNANTTINGTRVNLDGSPDLTNVNTDGSHVIWLDTAMLTVANSTPNRTFSQINGKGNSGTSTAYVDVEDAYFNNLLNKKWSIGGKLDGALDHPSVKVLWGQANTTNTFGHVRGDGMIGWASRLLFFYRH